MITAQKHNSKKRKIQRGNYITRFINSQVKYADVDQAHGAVEEANDHLTNLTSDHKALVADYIRFSTGEYEAEIDNEKVIRSAEPEGYFRALYEDDYHLVIIFAGDDRRLLAALDKQVISRSECLHF
jgi:hypothetical protein